MSLVNELQESAERDDVLTVLRKAKRLSSKLSRHDISDWLSYEQDGYPAGVELPSYRRIKVSFCYKTNGYIPAGFGLLQNGICDMPWANADVTSPVTESIAAVVAWIEQLAKGKGSLYRELGVTGFPRSSK